MTQDLSVYQKILQLDPQEWVSSPSTNVNYIDWSTYAQERGIRDYSTIMEMRFQQAANLTLLTALKGTLPNGTCRRLTLRRITSPGPANGRGSLATYVLVIWVPNTRDRPESRMVTSEVNRRNFLHSALNCESPVERKVVLMV